MSQVSSGALHQRKKNAIEAKIAVIGLTRTSASLGMALRNFSARGNAPVIFTVKGFDEDAEKMKKAQSMGAVDQINKDLQALLDGVAIVIVDVPMGVQADYFDLIGDYIGEGSVVLDLAPLKKPGVTLAGKHFPRDRQGQQAAYLVGATPLTRYPELYEDPNDITQASADLFEGNDLVIVPSAKTPQEAVKVANDIAGFLDMKVRFMDPDEYDGLAGLTAAMPDLLAMLLFHTVQQSQGQNDLLRVANYRFGNSLRNLRHSSPADMRAMWQENRMNVLHHIEQMAVALENIREVLLDNDTPVLEAFIETVNDSFEEWEIRRRDNRWDEDIQAAAPDATASTMGGFISNVFSFGRRGDKDDEK
jgi:prephenate dehydrogenase